MKRVQNAFFVEPEPKNFYDTVYECCNFYEYNFFKSTIKNCVFINYNFEGSNFSKAKLKGCKFVDCFMQFCAMTRIQIRHCEFISCDMWHSNLCHSSIHETLFEQCIVRALFKELDWKNNTYDEDTIVESCGGTVCGLDESLLRGLLESSRRTVDRIS